MYEKKNSHAIAKFFVDDLFDALPVMRDSLVKPAQNRNISTTAKSHEEAK